MIKIKRVYDPVESGDGPRYLVDRLWPRGVKKESLQMAGWVKEAAPSDDLRKWYGKEVSRWDEFRRRYLEELDGNPAGWQPLLDEARRGDVTLLYGKADTAHNNAAVLRDYLLEKLGEKA